MPIVYALLLIACRKALKQRRETQLARATKFLHREYTSSWFWWEVLPLVQRLVLTGWLLLIPSTHDSWRIFAGLLVAVSRASRVRARFLATSRTPPRQIGYLTLLQFVRPYKRDTINLLAIAAQFSLVCVYLGGAFVKVFANATTGDDANDGTSTAVFRVVIIMVVFNFAVLTLFLSLAMYQFAMSEVLPSIRLAATGQAPELRLRKGQTWHLFLSHIWSSGQDQMATLKRQLMLLLPGVKVFLDVVRRGRRPRTATTRAPPPNAPPPPWHRTTSRRSATSASTFAPPTPF